MWTDKLESGVEDKNLRNWSVSTVSTFESQPLSNEVPDAGRAGFCQVSQASRGRAVTQSTGGRG